MSWTTRYSNWNPSYQEYVKLRWDEIQYLLKVLYKIKGDVVEASFQTDDKVKKNRLRGEQKMLIHIIQNLENSHD